MTTLTVKINNRIGFSAGEIKKHDEACRLVQSVINTREFRDAVISKKFTSTNKTGLEVYQHIMTGSEGMSPISDHEIDVDVELYYSDNSTVGYTYPNTLRTWVNTKFFSSYTAAEVAGNLVHEWLHKLGYDHSSARDHNSVPYLVGYLIRDMINRHLEGFTYHLLDAATLPDFDPPVVIEPAKYICRRSWKSLWLKKVCWYE